MIERWQVDDRHDQECNSSIIGLILWLAYIVFVLTPKLKDDPQMGTPAATR